MPGEMSRTIPSLFALALVILAGCDGETEPPIPEMPTYATDVRPIFEAHCVRCHNETLSGDTNPLTGGLDRPSMCHLNRFESTGDCSNAGIASGACSFGAQYCGTEMPGSPPSSYVSTFVSLPQDQGGMPPLPAAPLSAREKEIILRWATVNPAP
jgi:hypothetical protein